MSSNPANFAAIYDKKGLEAEEIILSIQEHWWLFLRHLLSTEKEYRWKNNEWIHDFWGSLNSEPYYLCSHMDVFTSLSNVKFKPQMLMQGHKKYMSFYDKDVM